jgi:hypothetical protein
MKTTSIITKIAFTTAIIISNLTTSWAASNPSHYNIENNFNKTETQTSAINSPKTDSYLMVMQQQVERGDVSITYLFYMDQLKNIYQINQFNADLNINEGFYLNNLVYQGTDQLLASDQQITDKFQSENAE